MSITPMTTGPSVAPTGPAAGDGAAATGDPATPGSFAALVADLLAGTTDPDATGEGSDPTAEETTDGSGAAVATDQLAAAVPTAVPLWAQVAATVSPQTPQVPAKPAQDAAAAAGPVEGVLHGPVVTRATAPGGTAPAPAAAATGTAATGTTTTGTTTTGSAAPTGADTATAATTTDAPASTSGDTAAATGDQGGSGTGDRTGDRATGSGGQPATAAQAPAPTVAAPVAPLDPGAATAASAGVASLAPSAPSAPAAPVADARPVPAMTQVVPEVTRLVQRGDGVHRLTMKLQPEALGEVRVTLTLRDGAVQVQLTGGEHAARALAEGAPELRRVLELAGAAEARVVVRDLAGQQTATAGHQQGSLGQHAGQHPGQQPGTSDQPYGAQGAGGDASAPGRDGGQQDQHARTRGGAAARDGLTDGATALRPEPVRGAPRGVDVTM